MSEKRDNRLGIAGQAERAAQVDEMIRRAQDPNDAYDGGDAMAAEEHAGSESAK